MAKRKVVPRNKQRCEWAGVINDEYIRYHDEEWGVPVRDDRKQFEFLILEGAQAVLIWGTIRSRREGYRKAFADFDTEKVARCTKKRTERLRSDERIIRNRLKIESAVTNAQAFLAVQEEFGTFSSYIWQFVDGKTRRNRWKTMKDVPVTTSQSDALGRDLNHRGFKFVGSTIMYAHMQAVGMVNDHLVSCFRHQECAKLAR